MIAPARYCTQFELRRCDACSHENVRLYREDREAELACSGCGGHDFTLYDLVAVERRIGYSVIEGGLSE